MFERPSWIVRLVVTGLAAAAVPVGVWAQQASEASQAPPAEGFPPVVVENLPKPPEIPDVKQGMPTLATLPVRRGEVGPNVRLVDATPLPRDRQGIWVLDFAFKPVRLRTIEVPGKGRRQVHYLYYRVVNKTGAPRPFVPQFTLITDTGKRYEDAVIPQAVPVIQAREDPAIPLRGAVEVVGILPPGGQKEGIDDAVFGVAVWEGVDPNADTFSIYVRGLSDGYQLVPPPQGGPAVVRYKTLRLDFLRPGDERNLNEQEIHLADPPYEWIYW